MSRDIKPPRTGSSGNASRAMTIEASARPPSALLPRQNVARMNVERSPMNCETVPQDFPQSESAVCQAHWKGDLDGVPGTLMDESSSSEALRWQDRPSSAPVGVAMGVSQLSSLPRNSKSRQNLQLPPFKSLGIVVPHPDFLLTPPYETDIKWNASTHDSSKIPPTTPILRPISVTSEGTTPETPYVHEFISESTTNTSTTMQAPAQGTITEGAGLEEDNVERSSWVEQAVEIACKREPFRIRRTLTNDIQHRRLRVMIQPPMCSMCSVTRNRARSPKSPSPRRPFLPQYSPLFKASSNRFRVAILK